MDDRERYLHERYELARSMGVTMRELDSELEWIRDSITTPGVSVQYEREIYRRKYGSR